MHLLKLIGGVVLPGVCLVCNRAGLHLCARCKKELQPELTARCPHCFAPLLRGHACVQCDNSAPFRYVRYLFPYDDIVQSLITSMKYRPSYELARTIAELMANYSPALFGPHDLVVPIPISYKSYRLRGFNQSAVIAKAVGGTLKIKVSNRALRHTGYRVTQASLPARERWDNVQAAFRPAPSIVRGKSVLLVDDVITTGATTRSAAIQLLNAGAHSVTAYAFARSTFSLHPDGSRC